MGNNTDLINQIVNKEKELGLYKYSLFGIPFWRIVRWKVRVKYLKNIDGFESNTKKRRANYRIITVNIVKSFFSFFHFLLFFKSAKNIVLAFPRLQNVGDFYVDKFTDPLIPSLSDESLFVFQRPETGFHKSPRTNDDKVIKTDFIIYFSYFLGLFLAPFIFILKYGFFLNVYRKAKPFFCLSYRDLFFFVVKAGSFIVQYQINTLVLIRMRTKRIFLVDREIYYPEIVAAKRLGIISYELQHGVTNGPTPLYSGEFDPTIDPDFFLLFSNRWRGDHFTLPLDQQINIGWAYADFLSSLINSQDIKSNVVLVISSPEITEVLIRIVAMLSFQNSEVCFHIRLHPQEQLSSDQVSFVNDFCNIEIKDNSVDSAVVLEEYKYVIGENSTVLYEALAKQKIVGRLCLSGLKPEGRKINDGFIYIENTNDFDYYLKLKIAPLKEKTNLNVYEPFDSKFFKEILK